MTTVRVIRPVAHHFDCGELQWRVRSLVLEERLDAPFCAELRLVTEGAPTMADLLDRPAVLSMTRDEATRVFHGEATRVELFNATSGRVHARIRFEPTLARARRTVHHRIFQGQSVVEIVQAVLGAVVDPRFELALARERTPRDYCVQYGETDLAFVSRLLEDEGIAWRLDCSDARPLVRLVERADGWPEIDTEDGEVPYVPAHYEEASTESIQAITLIRRTPSAGVVERDWQWISEPAVHEALYPAGGDGARTEWTGPRRWAVDGIADSAHVEYERAAARDITVQGTSNATAFAPGAFFPFDLGAEAPEPLLVTAVMHRADCPEVELAAGGHAGGANYTNTFEGQPLAIPYRPARRHARARIDSLHTAVVTGPAGEEIHTDEHGRIRVRMHWDRSDSAPELASCWIRVGQTWAGGGWGSVFIPRVGMEVLVAFVDGDPDRPLCIGCVYNGANRPPYALPDDRTKSTIRTQSSPGGKGHNELTFEDAAGHEEVYLRAQRNLREVVLANHSEQVGVDDTASVGRDRKTTIDRHETHNVGGDRVREVGGSEGVTVMGSQHVVVLGGPGGGTEVGAPTPPGADMLVHGSYTLDVRDRITVRCGPSLITLDAAGITLVGPMVSIAASGSTLALAPGVAAMHAEAVGLTTAKSGLQMADDVKLTSEHAVKLQVDGSRLTLDGTARLRAPNTLVEGERGLEVRSDTSVSVLAPAIDLAADDALTLTCSAAVAIQGASITSAATGAHTITGLRIDLNPPGGAPPAPKLMTK